MAQVKIYQFGPEGSYAYDIIDDEGNIFLTGDGYESVEEIKKWLGDLLRNLTNANWSIDIE